MNNIFKHFVCVLFSFVFVVKTDDSIIKIIFILLSFEVIFIVFVLQVRENVHLFGGDCNQITIFCESAGNRCIDTTCVPSSKITITLNLF